MTSRESSTAWEQRILRARHLARTDPAASDALDFYAVLASSQEIILEKHAGAIRSAETFDASLDLVHAADALPELLSTIGRVAPPPLSAAADEMKHAGGPAWQQLMEGFWTARDDQDPVRGFIAEALLQPFAEAIAIRFRPEAIASVGRVPPACPVCGGKPVVAVLREEGQGAKRSLVCGFCLTESPTTRVVCVACGEGHFKKLAVYRAEEFPAAHVDCCETCKAYTKTVDLTTDGTAVPIVDDIATLPLDLWAREQGYQRIRPNLLRL